MNYFEEILKKVSQEEIMQRYFPEPIVIGKLYVSPFRYDKNPTCSFKYIGGLSFLKILVLLINIRIVFKFAQQQINALLLML
jgi:hypothetical protein